MKSVLCDPRNNRLLSWVQRLSLLKEGCDILVEKFLVCRACPGPGRVTPERWDGLQSAEGNKRRFIAGILDGEPVHVLRLACGMAECDGKRNFKATHTTRRGIEDAGPKPGRLRRYIQLLTILNA